MKYLSNLGNRAINIYKILLIVLLPSVLFLVLYNFFENNSYENELRSKYNAAEKFLLFKKIKSVKKILPDSLFSKKNYLCIMIYTGFDCGSCVEKAYVLAEEIDSLYLNNSVFIIGSKTNFGRDQLLYNYNKFVFNDSQENIRQELKFIYSPVLLLIDSIYSIKAVYFPLIDEIKLKKEKFINSIKNISSDM